MAPRFRLAKILTSKYQQGRGPEQSNELQHLSVFSTPGVMSLNGTVITAYVFTGWHLQRMSRQNEPSFALEQSDTF
jgi:hypothetical protein